MNDLLEKFNITIEKTKIINLSVFSDSNINKFNTPYIKISFSNTNIQYTISERDAKTQKRSVNNNDEPNDDNIVKQKIGSLYKEIKKNNISFYYYHSFKRDYDHVARKKLIDYIKSKYNINFNDNIYLYVENHHYINTFGTLEYKFLSPHVNKLITNPSNFYMVYFSGISTETYEKKVSLIIKYIIDVVNLLEKNGNMVLRSLYVPFNEEFESLCHLLIHCFEKIIMIFPKWENNVSNSVYVLLINKKENIIYDKSLKLLNVTINKNPSVEHNKKLLLQYFIDIIDFLELSYRLSRELFIIGKTNGMLYGELKSKILEKIKKM